MARPSTASQATNTPAPGTDAMVAPSADPSKVAKRVYLEAGPCPVNPAHKTRVYHTEGKVRNCACDDCGATFKKVGNYADPLRDAADSLATMFETSESVVVEEGGPEVILVEAAEARSFAARLRKLLP